MNERSTWESNLISDDLFAGHIENVLIDKKTIEDFQDGKRKSFFFLKEQEGAQLVFKVSQPQEIESPKSYLSELLHSDLTESLTSSAIRSLDLIAVPAIAINCSGIELCRNAAADNHPFFSEILNEFLGNRIHARELLMHALNNEIGTFYSTSFSSEELQIRSHVVPCSSEVYFILVLVNSSQDNTNQKNTTDLIKLAKRGFKQFFSYLDEGIIICKSFNQIEYFNHSIFNLITSLDSGHQNQVDFNSLDDLPPSIYAPIYRLINQAKSSKSATVSTDVWIENQKADKRRFLTFRYIGMQNASKDNSHFFIVIQDHTELKNALGDQTKLKEFYEQILDELPTDVAVFDSNHRYLYVNQLGIKNSDIRNWIIGKTDFDYCELKNINAQVAIDRSSYFKKALNEKQTQSFISVHKNASSDEYIFRKFYPVVKNNRVEFVIGYGTNVTELQHANLELTIQEARFKQLFETSPALMVIIDNHYKIIEGNQAFRKLFSHLNDSYLNQNIRYVFPEGNFLKIKTVVESMSVNDNKESFLCQIELPSGTYYFEMMVSTMPASESSHLVLIGIDITKRHEMEVKFSSSQTRLNILLDAIQTVPYEVIPNTWHEFRYLHPNIKQLIGYAPDQVISQNDFWRSKIHPEDQTYFMDVLNTMEELGSARLEYRVKHANGDYRWVRDHVKVQISTSGIIESTSGLLEDVTDQHQSLAETEALQRCQFWILRLVQQNYADIKEVCEKIVLKIKDELRLKAVQIWDYYPDKSGFGLFASSENSQHSEHDLINEKFFFQNNQKEILHFISTGNNAFIDSGSLIGLIRRDGKLKGFVCLSSHENSPHWSFPYIQFIQSVADQISLMAESYTRRSAQFKLETALEYGNIIVAEINQNTSIIEWSDSGKKYFSEEAWKKCPVSLLDFEELIHPDDLIEFTYEYKLLLESATPIDRTFRLIDGNGRLHYVDFKIKSAPGENTIAKKTIGILQDVTKKVFAELELNRVNESTNMLNSLIASLRNLKSERAIRETFSEQIISKLSIADCFFVEKDANQYFHTIDKWSQAKGKTHEIAAEILLSTKKLMDQAWNSGQPAMEFIYLKAAGNKKTQFIIIPFGIHSNSEHLIIAYCTAYEEASDTRADFMMKGVEVLRTRIREIRREIELIKVNQDLKVSNEQLHQYSYIISHNLRAPVSNLHGIVNLIQPESINGERNRLLFNKMGETVHVIDQILKDMNDLLHLKDSVEFKLSRNSISDAYQVAKKMLGEDIYACEAEFQEDFGSDPQVLSYKPYLMSVFQNLISNALKFRDTSRKLLVKVGLYQPDQNTVVLSFSDNGIGIDLQRNKERIFRLYSRFHRDVPGSGIGLYLVNEQMKAQQGKIQVESAPGEGTEFKLFFNLVNQTHGNLAN